MLSKRNTLWRDAYRRAWAGGLVAAVLVHAFLFLFMPRGAWDRFHESLLPSPTVLFAPGAPGSELEVVQLRAAGREAPQPEPPLEVEPEPEPEESIIPVPAAQAPVEISVAEVAAASTAADGEDDRTASAGESPGETGPGVGGGWSPPRPVHLVVPRVPGSVDRRRAHGRSVHLLVEVLADGSVGEVRVEKGSRILALDQAALAAARQLRYAPARQGGANVAQWTRTEMRF